MADVIPAKRKAGRPKGSGTSKNPKSFNARMTEYEKSMPKMQLNDRALVQVMIKMELEFETFQKDIAKCENPRDKSKLQDSYNNMLKEYRQIQDSLGMGRGQRDTSINMQQEIDKLVEEAEELVKKVGVPITCHYCESAFEMGTLIFHFRDDVPWAFDFSCPKCNQITHISGMKLFPKVIEGTLSS